MVRVRPLFVSDLVLILLFSENCTPPSDASGYDIANNIRMMAHTYGSVKSLKAYLEITDQVSSARALAMRSELQTSGVSLIDCPHNGRKDVADKMIMGEPHPCYIDVGMCLII